MKSSGWIVALCLMAVGTPALAQTGWSDATKGRELAESLCSVCHRVGPEVGPAVVAEVPSFRSIANRPGQSPERLVAAIIIPHPAMPTVSFTNQELRDIIAYILTLKAQEPASK
jgi:mono/diheme cytochrome c family protein